MRFLAVITSAVTAGEAIALWPGMHLLSGRPNPWLAWKNDVLLALDVATGLALLAMGVDSHVP